MSNFPQTITQKHPAGLSTLFFTEMWERFSYYGMRAILVLYMVAAVSDGGLGFPNSKATDIYAVYTMLVYLTSLPGGYLADRFLGTRRAIFIGGVIIACGHFSMAVPSLTTFFLGLGLITFGTGLLKPNVSTLLGTLYTKDDPRKDAGFSIFYMGINIGAALAPLVCGYFAQSPHFKAWLTTMGIDPLNCWHFGFGAAGVGMILGLLHFVFQGKTLETNSGESSQQLSSSLPRNEVKEPLSKDDWSRLSALGLLLFFDFLFWSIYEQGGSSLTLFADRLTRCEILGWQFPSSWFQSLQAIFVIMLAPIFSWLWMRMGVRQPSSPAKFAYGLLFLAIGITFIVPAAMLSLHGKVSPLWLCAVYFLEVVGEMCLSPVGLSTVTKLAPVQIASFTMGAWFCASALANLAAGKMAGFFDHHDPTRLVWLFGSMSAAAFMATLLLVMLLPRIRKLMGDIK